MSNIVICIFIYRSHILLQISCWERKTVNIVVFLLSNCLSSCHVRARFQEKSKHIAVAGHHGNSPGSEDLDDEDVILPPKNTKYVVLFYYQKYM